MRKTKSKDKKIEQKKNKLVEKITEKMAKKVLPTLQKKINKKEDYIGETFKVLKDLQDPKSKLAKKTEKIVKEAVKETREHFKKQKKSKKKINFLSTVKPSKPIMKKAVRTDDIPIPVPIPIPPKEQKKKPKLFNFKITDMLPDLSHNKVPTPEEIRKMRIFEENKPKYYKLSALYWIKRVIFKQRFNGWCDHKKMFYKTKKTNKGYLATTICKKCYQILKENEEFNTDI